MRIALVANPTSGRGRHGGAAHAAITALLTAGHDVIVVQGSSYDESRANATALLERDGGVDAWLWSEGMAPSTSASTS